MIAGNILLQDLSAGHKSLLLLHYAEARLVPYQCNFRAHTIYSLLIMYAEMAYFKKFLTGFLIRSEIHAFALYMGIWMVDMAKKV